MVCKKSTRAGRKSTNHTMIFVTIVSFGLGGWMGCKTGREINVHPSTRRGTNFWMFAESNLRKDLSPYPKILFLAPAPPKVYIVEEFYTTSDLVPFLEWFFKIAYLRHMSSSACLSLSMTEISPSTNLLLLVDMNWERNERVYCVCHPHYIINQLRPPRTSS